MLCDCYGKWEFSCVVDRGAASVCVCARLLQTTHSNDWGRKLADYCSRLLLGADVDEVRWPSSLVCSAPLLCTRAQGPGCVGACFVCRTCFYLSMLLSISLTLSITSHHNTLQITTHISPDPIQHSATQPSGAQPRVSHQSSQHNTTQHNLAHPLPYPSLT